MYKIYINESLIELVDTSFEMSKSCATNTFCFNYSNEPNDLKRIIKLCEKISSPIHVIVSSTDVEETFSDFSLHYKIIEAAGGLVQNELNQLLMIFRRGHWDLPKGKIEEGEAIEDAAVREVVEETGVNSLVINDKITITYHTYKDKKGKRVLKISHWYLMYSNSQQLVPQVEEDIEKAEWKAINGLMDLNPIYSNISLLLEIWQKQ